MMEEALCWRFCSCWVDQASKSGEQPQSLPWGLFPEKLYNYCLVAIKACILSLSPWHCSR